MSRIIRVVVLATALISAVAAMASSAGAVTWHNSGSTAFTATAGPGSLTVTGVVGLSCTSADATGVTAASNFVGATWKAVHGTVNFTNCLTGGVPSPTHCTYDLTATTQPSVGVTTGVADVTCTVYQFNAKVCHITGTVHAVYHNWEGAVPGRLTLLHPGNLRTDTPCAAAIGGPHEPATLTSQAFTVTSGLPAGTLGPTITRTT
jgi:hypothetical protein